MSGLNKRHILDEADRITMDYMKSAVGVGVRLLCKNGVRAANIEIELMQHIKKELKKCE